MLRVAHLVTAIVLSAPVWAQRPVVGAAASEVELGPAFDNVRDRALNFPTHQVDPLSFSFDEAFLYALNQPGARLAVFDAATMALVEEIPIGHGAVTVRTRFTPRELWVVDQITNAVIVIDANTSTIIHTIRVGASPRDLVFTPGFDRAYVTCGAVDRVDVIDATTYQNVASIPVPMNEPHSIELVGNHVWVASLRSGNNTAPMGQGPGPDADKVVAVVDLDDLAPQVAVLPDRDVVAIATTGPMENTVDPARTVRGVGTVLQNLHVRPGTNELWIPNTEALNADHTGERSFVAGQVVSNRITIVDAQTSTVLQIVDLDQLAPPGSGIGQPTGIAFTPDGSRAFVISYGNDLVAVLDVNGGAVTLAGVVRVPITIPYPRGSGPRTAVVDAQGQRLHVYNKQNNSVTTVQLSQLPGSTGFDWVAPVPVFVGYNPLGEDERHGRMHFVRAIDSASQTSSCASCHIDGTSDGVAWELSSYLDPEGTPPGSVHFGLDEKGPMVTQNTVRLFPTSPYHWRGERPKLKQFNKTFRFLFERTENGSPANLGPDFQYIIHYMQRLTYPPNPRQELDRSLSPLQKEGARLFHGRVLDGGVTCSTCHQLPLGTSGEIVPTGRGGLAPTAVVPSLRGVADKESPSFAIGGAFEERTELGAGFLHDGARPSLEKAFALENPNDGIEGHAFEMGSQEAQALSAYLRAFDTGLAPSTVLMVTAHAGNAAGIAGYELPLLLDQAERGWCDVVVRKGPVTFQGQTVQLSGVYDTDTDMFVYASTTIPAQSPAQLIAEAQAGSPITFLGTPGMMGQQVGIDRDRDEVLDLDELVLGTDPERPDTDIDGFPDGYEVGLGMDPLSQNGIAPDSVAPALAGPARLVYATTTAIKFEYDMDEPCRTIVSYNGQLPVMRLPLAQDYDTEFSVTLFELLPDTTYDITLEVFDPAGNTRFEQVTFHTMPQFFDSGVFVNDMTLSIELGSGGGANRLAADIELSRGDTLPDPGYQIYLDVFHERTDGLVQEVYRGLTGDTTAADGRVLITAALPSTATLGGPGTIYVVPVDVVPPGPNASPYVGSRDATSFETVDY